MGPRCKGALLVLFLAACVSPEAATEVRIEVYADRLVQRYAQQVRLVGHGGSRGNSEPSEDRQELTVAIEDVGGWPVTHTLAPRGNLSSRLYRVDATAIGDDGRELAHARAISGYLEGESLVLRIRFFAACLDLPPCENLSQSCGSSGDCDLPSQTAPQFLRTTNEDAGPVPECTHAADCEDGVACTVEECLEGRCENRASDEACAPGPGRRCDAESGCQYDECNPDLCTAGPCETARCDGTECVREASCGPGEECCGDACVPLGCNDRNPCTDDRCDGSECVYANNSGSCSDLRFCNGEEVCRAGTCAEGVPPCAPSLCDEEARTCGGGCTDDEDCPRDETMATGSCAYADDCVESGSQPAVFVDWSCVASTCQSVMSVATPIGCSRATDGNSCGATSTIPGRCGCPRGERRVTTIVPECAAGECAMVSMDTIETCFCPDAGPPDAGYDGGLGDAGSDGGVVAMDGGV